MEHTGYVVAAYAISAIVLGGLITWIIARDRMLRAEALRLEDRP